MEAVKNTIGNIAPINKKLNASASNNSWLERSARYTSDLKGMVCEHGLLTQILAVPHWNIKALRIREVQLLNHLQEIYGM